MAAKYPIKPANPAKSKIQPHEKKLPLSPTLISILFQNQVDFFAQRGTLG